EAFQRQNTVHAIHAEELGSVVHVLSLLQNQRSFLIVDGQEQQVSTGCLCLTELNREVGCAGSGEGGGRNDVQTLCIRFGLELFIDTRRIRGVVLVNDSDFGAQLIFRNVVSRSGALTGVGEAHLEHIVLALGDGGGRSRRGQCKDAVSEVFG